MEIFGDMARQLFRGNATLLWCARRIYFYGSQHKNACNGWRL